MRSTALQRTFTVISYVVLALMAVAMIYASGIGIIYWAGIGV